MRWKGLIFLAALTLIWVVLSMFFLDKWVEAGIEDSASSVVGARVDIDGLKIDLANLSIKLDRLQVTDPDKTSTNLIETGRIAFSMNMAALLRRRSVIREMSLKDVRIGTRRASDGALPKKPEKKKEKDSQPGLLDKAKDRLTDEVNQLPVMDFDFNSMKKNLNLDSLIVLTDLTMPGKLDSAQTQIKQTSEDWDNFFKSFKPDEDLKDIQNTFSQIEPAKIKTVPQLMTTLNEARSARTKLISIQDTVKTRKIRLQNDFKVVKNYTTSVDDWYKQDYRNILSKAKLPDLSVTEIGKILFGPVIVQRVQQTIGMVQNIRSRIPQKSNQKKKEKPSRLEGQTVHFADFHAWPSFLIENIDLSGKTGYGENNPGLTLKGNATGITSQPWIYGQPARFSAKGQAEDGRALELSGVLDHVEDKSEDFFEFNLRNMNLNNFSIGKSPYLPDKIKSGRGDLTASAIFEDQNFDIKVDIKTRKLEFDFSQFESSNQFVDIVHEVISNLDVITVQSRIQGTGEDLKISLDSNLDEKVSRELKSMGTKALKDAQNQVRGRLESIRNEKMREVNQLLDEKQSEFEGKIKFYEEKVDEYRMMAEAKIEEIEKDIDKRKKAEEDKLKNKAEETLKNLF